MIKEAFKWFKDTNLMTEHLSKIRKDKDGYGLRFLILANAAKDAINCGFYVNQSLNNKDIPEEKRKFVAALDMANGVLMIAAQIALGFGFTSKKAQDWMTGKIFGGLKERISKLVKEDILSHASEYTGDYRIKLLNIIERIPKECKTGFKAISTIVVTTVIAKRIIVPFIATPLASWVKKNYMDKNSPEDKNNSQITKPKAPEIVQTAGYQPITQNTYPYTSRGSFENFNNFVQMGKISL